MANKTAWSRARIAAAVVAGAFAMLAQPVTVLAHGGSHSLASAALTKWEWEPYTLTLLVASAVLYAAGVRRLWRRAGTGKGISRWQATSYAAGLVSVFIALISPLAWLSEVMFSLHMTQHEILMLIAAPLLVFGQPLFTFLWALPPSSREAWGRWSRRPAVVVSWRALTGPLAVFVSHGLALWVWHLPVLYEAALANRGIHALQHLSFTLTAALFWWGMVHGRYGRMGYGLAVVYVFLTGVHSTILGALLTIAPGLWYPSYAAAAATWHVDPLEDQQLAGLLMWVPSSLVFIGFGLALFSAWLGESDKRAALGSIAAARMPPVRLKPDTTDINRPEPEFTGMPTNTENTGGVRQ